MGFLGKDKGSSMLLLSCYASFLLWIENKNCYPQMKLETRIIKCIESTCNLILERSPADQIILMVNFFSMTTVSVMNIAHD
jgi:hypothetical protein